MLIYNTKKEFMGIEENDLKTLGFKNLSELKAEADDFADLFVKTPGYIHNFKHVNWIDYIECDDSSDSPKVIIHANSNSFRCTLDVKTVFLTDHPSSEAYLVYLNNIRQLTDGEHKNVSADIQSKISQTAKNPLTLETKPTAQEPVENEEIVEEIEEIEDVKEIEDIATEDTDSEYIASQESTFELTADLDEQSVSEKQIDVDDNPIDLDLPLDVNFDDDEEDFQPALEIGDASLEDELKLDTEEDLVEEEYSEMGIYDNGYMYDPQIASNELGLPIDLIEEFIEDFIAQAKEFKAQLYRSLEDGDYDNVKILSHKLKGVAANLRIEDAFETLTLINTTDNPDKILTNLDILYKIISKLSGEKIPLTKKKTVDKDLNTTEDESAEDTIHELKDIETTQEQSINLAPISDNEVPEKIDIPELADDEFLNQEDEDKVELNDTLDIETISDEETMSIENESIDIGEIELLDEHKENDYDEDLTLADTDSKPISYDKTTVANEIGIPYESFLDLFDDFVTEIQDISNSISGAIETNDSKVWRTKAVQLKGMSDNMRINEFTKEAEILMRTEDAETAKDAYEKIEKSIVKISNLKG